MKLASLKSGRDGALIVVSRDIKTAVKVPEIAPTMQFALDNWDELEGKLQEVFEALNGSSAVDAFELDMNQLILLMKRHPDL